MYWNSITSGSSKTSSSGVNCHTAVQWSCPQFEYSGYGAGDALEAHRSYACLKYLHTANGFGRLSEANLARLIYLWDFVLPSGLSYGIRLVRTRPANQCDGLGPPSACRRTPAAGRGMSTSLRPRPALTVMSRNWATSRIRSRN